MSSRRCPALGRSRTTSTGWGPPPPPPPPPQSPRPTPLLPRRHRYPPPISLRSPALPRRSSGRTTPPPPPPRASCPVPAPAQCGTCALSRSRSTPRQGSSHRWGRSPATFSCTLLPRPPMGYLPRACLCCTCPSSRKTAP